MRYSNKKYQKDSQVGNTDRILYNRDLKLTYYKKRKAKKKKNISKKHVKIEKEELRQDYMKLFRKKYKRM